MEFTGTVERLMNLQAVYAEKKNHSAFAREALERLIDAQVDRVKIRIMTHCFDALDYFNGKTN